MSIFAGAISLQAGLAIPGQLAAGLRRHLSRSGSDIPVDFRAEGLYLAAVDIGAFGAPGTLKDSSGNATVIAGEPLVRGCDDHPEWNREHDAARLHASLSKGRLDVLRACRGTFCGLHFNHGERALTLFVDRTGVRPLFVWITGDFVIFATALRILEALPGIDRHFDLRGVAETATFGYPLADRTAYRDITMLRAGQLARVANGKLTRELYWRWDGELDAGMPYPDAVNRAYKEFTLAIARRQRSGKLAAAFLSGGLDSRAIVGGLHARGCDVHTVNYAPDGSQDQVFATLVAAKLGLKHTQLQTNARNVAQAYRKDAVARWLEASFPPNQEKPSLLWSGDGGSVALGHVYLTPAIAAAMQAGDITKTATLFTPHVSLRLIQPPARKAVQELPLQGMEEELAAIDGPDGGRRFHLFLMLNDQRRHLVRHFEDLDLERIEFQLPFLDADFLASILRLPSEPMMFHRFYMDWLDRFPNRLAATHWQHYPGHAACPLPIPAGLKYQWHTYYDKRMYRQMRLAVAREGLRIALDRRFPAHIVSRSKLAASVLMTGLGAGDYSYLIKMAAIFHRHWKCTA